MKSIISRKKFIPLICAVFIFVLTACGGYYTDGEAAPTEAVLNTPDIIPKTVNEECFIEISEVMIKNSATVTDKNGHFHPWVELHNTAEKSVELSGLSLSVNGKKEAALPQLTLESDEYKVLFLCREACDDPSVVELDLDAGDTLSLLSPNGDTADSVTLSDTKVNISFCRSADTSFAPTEYATPGYPNTDEGYCSLQEQKDTPAALAIYEVSPASPKHEDFIELVNLSDEEILLSDYFLSDKLSDLQRAKLPDMKLAPGKTCVFYCDEELGFSLDPNKDSVYLSNSRGCADFVPLSPVPAGGSIGRMKNSPGWYLFSAPTPKEENISGARQASAAPDVNIRGGVYEGIESLSIEFTNPSAVFYTVGCEKPTVDSELYTKPIPIKETSVIRAISLEEGKLPSEVMTFSYIINEDLYLPVVSIVSDAGRFGALSKEFETGGNISFFENGGSFSENCGITLSGNKSLNYPKKSLNVKFKNCYGSPSVCYDMFDGGICEFESFTIRAGQDYTETVIKNELWQDVCLEATDNVLCQRSRYCVMFFNGEYFGVYALKENLSKSLFASVNAVSKDDVEEERLEAPRGSAFLKEVYEFCQINDMSDEENYRHISELIDIDSFADYFVVMGFSGNNDLARNVRLYRCPGAGIKWTLAFFDLDMASRDTSHSFTNLMAPYDFEGSSTLRTIYRSLIRNRTFRQLLIERFSRLYGNTLSNEDLLDIIDSYCELLAPALVRDRERWLLEYSDWEKKIVSLRDLFLTQNWQECALDNFCEILSLTDAEKAQYFS